MRHMILAAMLLAPVSAFAVGSDDDAPPEPTESVTECEEGLVYDEATETCVTPEETTNDDSARMEDIRSLAYEGRYADALGLLETMDPGDPMVLTYYGFVSRKMGDVPAGMDYYAAALEADPDLLLARAYRGMAFIEAEDTVSAWTELQEIQARGGRGSWPEQALIRAIETGETIGY
ncbi:tetratricopeptide repeat protein [Pelagovum pacificum]|uniref:Tetratricopeptide repeat protein n=1 Tax=Pelagovum pacificum TaxID=2588711 RepID=A0A5C5GFS9_9RHOB|nr:hypothetical protein [Pelagovum pacificum]QQA43254.1 hypothetical protein I8N54_01390 [Pelagovum pacificum]TNY33608.1 hypothetical protein FHY64_10135 [Pelagovum pacificum]